MLKWLDMKRGGSMVRWIMLINLHRVDLMNTVDNGRLDYVDKGNTEQC